MSVHNCAQPDINLTHVRGLIYCSLSRKDSLRSWRDFARECFCFGTEAVNTSGEAVRGLVKSRVGFTRASPAPESRQLRRLAKSVGSDIVGD